MSKKLFDHNRTRIDLLGFYMMQSETHSCVLYTAKRFIRSFKQFGLMAELLADARAYEKKGGFLAIHHKKSMDKMMTRFADHSLHFFECAGLDHLIIPTSKYYKEFSNKLLCGHFSDFEPTFEEYLTELKSTESHPLLQMLINHHKAHLDIFRAGDDREQGKKILLALAAMRSSSEEKIKMAIDLIYRSKKSTLCIDTISKWCAKSMADFGECYHNTILCRIDEMNGFGFSYPYYYLLRYVLNRKVEETNLVFRSANAAHLIPHILEWEKNFYASLSLKSTEQDIQALEEGEKTIIAHLKELDDHLFIRYLKREINHFSQLREVGNHYKEVDKLIKAYVQSLPGKEVERHMIKDFIETNAKKQVSK